MAELQSRVGHTGIYMSTSGDHRARFQGSLGEQFGRVILAEDVDMAAAAVARHPADIVVLDLNGYQSLPELAGIGALIRGRNGAPTLVLCPFQHSSWLPELMAYGPFQYRITPLLDEELRQTIAQMLAPASDPVAAVQQQLLDKEIELRDLLTLQRSVQRALGGMEEVPAMASQICRALCSFPGVRHTALLYLKERGDLQLVAQESRNHLDLGRLMQRSDRLLQSALRDVLPPLLAAANGELVLLDAPEKAGDPELAVSLHGRDVRMLLALPLRAEVGGPVTGSISLMFDRHLQFSREQFAAFSSLAQFISFALGMSELKYRNDSLAAQLSQASTVDVLTGAANRRKGEDLLDAEIARARRYGLPLSLLSFQVDHFRSENALYGAPVGDVGLRIVAEHVGARLRGSDTLARMRGEEFLVLATHTRAEDAARLAAKLRDAVAGLELPGCQQVNISLAVLQVGGEENGAAALDRLDASLQRAKRSGRNSIDLSPMAETQPI